MLAKIEAELATARPTDGVQVIEIQQSQRAALHCAATWLRGGGHGGRSASE
jgi:hypothetical protein